MRRPIVTPRIANTPNTMRAIIHSDKELREAVTGLKMKDMNMKNISEKNHNLFKAILLSSCFPLYSFIIRHSSDKSYRRKRGKVGKICFLSS
jgi:hypothetical protein